MTRLGRAIAEAVRHFEARQIPYMIFGGLANLKWGRPRLTDDVDLKVDVDPADWKTFLAGLAKDFQVLPEDALEFARSTHVIPVESRDAVRIDVVLASLPYEREAIRRAVPVSLEDVEVRCCTAEDLILHKILSDRPLDRADVEGVVLRQGRALDRTYLDPRVRMFARDLERPDIVEAFQSALNRAGLESM